MNNKIIFKPSAKIKNDILSILNNRVIKDKKDNYIDSSKIYNYIFRTLFNFFNDQDVEIINNIHKESIEMIEQDMFLASEEEESYIAYLYELVSIILMIMEKMEINCNTIVAK